MHLPDGEEADVWLPLLGRQNVANALAAAAAAQAVGTSVEDIVAGLARATPVRGRLRAVPGRSGATIIDDSYNANPGSVRAAIDHLAALDGQADSRARQHGRARPDGARAAPGDRRVRARPLRHAARDRRSRERSRRRRSAPKAVPWPTSRRAAPRSSRCSRSDVTVLVKGSRVMGLDRLVRDARESSRGRTEMLIYVTDHLTRALLGLQRLQLSDDARDSRRADGARVVVRVRSVPDPAPPRCSASASRFVRSVPKATSRRPARRRWAAR